jgi:hypothetical protein
MSSLILILALMLCQFELVRSRIAVPKNQTFVQKFWKNATKPSTGKMIKMWSDGVTFPGPAIWGTCEYATQQATQYGNTTWLEPYVNKLQYCSMSTAILGGPGKACGQCYRITYKSSSTVSYSADVQIVDDLWDTRFTFNCHNTAYHKITGSTKAPTASDGSVAVTYNQIPCRPVAKPVVVILTGLNEWYVKILVAGGFTSVRTVRIRVGDNEYGMKKSNMGAAFTSFLSHGIKNQEVRFKILYFDGTEYILRGCFANNQWPVPAGFQCHGK